MSRVAIVDFGLGNLFSVRQACEHVGLGVTITQDPAAVSAADAVILPGVGAFGDAMDTLGRHGLVGALGEFTASGRPFLGICLGLQLLMTESREFGVHKGLGVIEGDVVKIDSPMLGDRALKVPHVGWNGAEPAAGSWDGSLLEGLAPGVQMYFVHSFIVRPRDPGVEVCRAAYGDTTFCCGVRKGAVEAYQFHPERSGEDGLAVYRNLARKIGEEA